MGGGMPDDWKLTPSTKGTSTIVLLGKAGNGKSATGNSILGRNAFVSDVSISGITSTCALQSTILRDGHIINVIDTPGLFDFTTGSEFTDKEIVNGINLAKEGIHAVLMVFSAISRFTREEEAAIQSMKSFFGDRIVDYMIIVFTGGDALEKKGKKTQDFISFGCPEPLKNIIQLCKNRVMVFDNNTCNRAKRAYQVDLLRSLVDSVVSANGGKPFSDDIFDELKKGALRLEEEEREIEAMEGCSDQQISELKEQLRISHEDQIKQVIEMIERKLEEAIKKLEKQLSEEQAARLEAEKDAMEAMKKSKEEIRKLMEELRMAREETQEFQKRAETRSGCAIL